MHLKVNSHLPLLSDKIAPIGWLASGKTSIHRLKIEVRQNYLICN